MPNESQLAVQLPPAMLSLASLTGLAQEYLIQTVKAQCFKGAATDAQVDAFISIACEMKVNPLLPGMLYAYPISGGGIVPIMGPSGVYKKLMEHPEVESWETKVYPEDVTLAPTHAVTKIYRKGRERPLEYTALMTEWKIDSNPNWGRRPRHMLALRSLKHCANQIIHGIPYDEDDRVIMGMQNVTPEADASASTVTDRPVPKPRAKKGVSAAAEVIVPPEEQTSTGATAEHQPPEGKVFTESLTAATKQATTSADILAEADAKAAKARQAEADAKAKRTEDMQQAAAKPDAKQPLAQRALLGDGEALTVEAQIDAFKVVTGTRDNKPWPYVTADIVSPELRGQVTMSDNSLQADGQTPIPAWQLDQPVRLALRGKKYKSGKLVNLVEKIEVIAGGVSGEPGSAEDV